MKILFLDSILRPQHKFSIYPFFWSDFDLESRTIIRISVILDSYKVNFHFESLIEYFNLKVKSEYDVFYIESKSNLSLSKTFSLFSSSILTITSSENIAIFARFE